MTSKTYEVDVIQRVTISVDESKFTPEFMQEFRNNHYDFDSIAEHVEHLAQLAARGITHEFSTFIEGYGPPKDFGIKFENDKVLEIEIQKPAAAA